MKHIMLPLIAAFFCSVVAAGAQTFPEGPGREILEKQCSTCHTAEVVKTFRHTAEEWEDVVATMNDQGAKVSDDELAVLVAYLEKNFGPRPGSTSAPSAVPPIAMSTMPVPAAQSAPTAVPGMPADYQQVLDALGRQGDFKDGVLKVNIPRSDLKVTVDGVATPMPFGFGGWVALEKGATGGMDVMMGDLVLTENEVNPVMSALLQSGIEVTALHNHFANDSPRIMYMHVHGHGSAAELAAKLKPALALIGKTPPAAGSPGRALDGALDTAQLAKIIGAAGEANGAVYKITIGRPDITMQEMGAPINARMGLNTWAAFYGSDADAVVAGDVAMLESEVQPVLKALRANGIDVVAIHHHMVGTQPTVIFLHYWGRGLAQKLATGVRAAVDQLGKTR